MNKGEGSMEYQGRRSGNMKERGPNHSWASRARSKPGMLKTLRAVYGLALMLGLIFMAPCQAEAAGQGAWQVGRAVIQKSASQQPVLKLSLRNDGIASKESLRILGRWAQGAPGKRGFSAGELGAMTELGSFTGEVALKKTAIIEVPLSALGTPPAGRTVLEIGVLTGNELTDGQAVQY
jgi:hypothetical protein